MHARALRGILSACSEHQHLGRQVVEASLEHQHHLVVEECSGLQQELQVAQQQVEVTSVAPIN